MCNDLLLKLLIMHLQRIFCGMTQLEGEAKMRMEVEVRVKRWRKGRNDHPLGKMFNSTDGKVFHGEEQWRRVGF